MCKVKCKRKLHDALDVPKREGENRHKHRAAIFIIYDDSVFRY
jgi:hypothetical protein